MNQRQGFFFSGFLQYFKIKPKLFGLNKFLKKFLNKCTKLPSFYILHNTVRFRVEKNGNTVKNILFVYNLKPFFKK